MFERAWIRALDVYDEFVGIDWEWLSGFKFTAHIKARGD